MAIYKYVCYDCEVAIEKDCTLGKAPMSVKCPQCKAKIERDYSKITFQIKGKPGKQGKENVDTFYNEAIADSKEYLTKMKSPYAKMDMTHEGAKKLGGSKVSDKRRNEKIEKTKELVEHANTRKNRK